MKFRAIVGATAIAFVLLATTASAQTIPTPSKWVNERGSILQIDAIDAQGAMTGTFTNQAPNTSCIGKTYPGRGYFERGRVVFTTTFVECNTVAVWRGPLNGNTISTRFEVAYPTKTGKLTIWRGRDRFTKQ